MASLLGTFILVTVGTSLLSHLRRDLGIPGLPSHQQALAHLRKADPTRSSCGAEINSLEPLLKGLRLYSGTTTGPFELAFLVSDTEDGYWMGKLLQTYYGSARGISAVSSVVVEGLSDHDHNKFARTGLRNLVRQSSKLLAQAKEKGLFRVINATGGFKAQISFAGLIGQTLGVPVVYQFESFPACVEMPPMPVSFDRQIWLTHFDLFTRLSEAGTMTEEEFTFCEVDPVIRDLLDWEQEDGTRLCALSPMLELMHQGFLSRPVMGVQEPPSSNRAPEEMLCFNEAEMPHAPRGTRAFALAMARKFPWIVEIRNVAFLNSQRTHPLPRQGDVSEHQVCFSDKDKGIRLRVRSTCRNDRQRDFAEQKLAEFCSHG